jgi:transposase
MFITVKKPTFEAKIRNSVDNLQTRYEWFMKWKDSDVDFEKNCVFIDEAGFNINMRSNWARSAIGIPAFVELEKTLAPSHTIIGAIHSSSVIHVAMKKPPPRKEKAPKSAANKSEKSKKRKLAKGKQRAGEIIIEEPVVEYVKAEHIDDTEANKAPSKGTTTAHFIKFMNELLDIMDMDEGLKGSYLVMDNCTIHKSHPMIPKIEGRGYRVMYLPPYSPELNAIENFWAIVKGKMKCENLMTEETLSQRIADAYNNVHVSDLRGFCGHSKRHITYCHF